MRHKRKVTLCPACLAGAASCPLDGTRFACDAGAMPRGEWEFAPADRPREEDEEERDASELPVIGDVLSVDDHTSRVIGVGVTSDGTPEVCVESTDGECAFLSLGRSR